MRTEYILFLNSTFFLLLTLAFALEGMVNRERRPWLMFLYEFSIALHGTIIVGVFARHYQILGGL